MTDKDVIVQKIEKRTAKDLALLSAVVVMLVGILFSLLK